MTDDKPKCMVEVNGKSIIERQLSVMYNCGIREEDITIVAGYKGEALQRLLKNTGINIIINADYENTNMVCSLMCAREIMEGGDDILISYGDIIYSEEVLRTILASEEEASVIVDDGWYSIGRNVVKILWMTRKRCYLMKKASWLKSGRRQRI